MQLSSVVAHAEGCGGDVVGRRKSEKGHEVASRDQPPRSSCWEVVLSRAQRGAHQSGCYVEHHYSHEGGLQSLLHVLRAYLY
ncbi:hypothetical protein NDU88_006811 [Pleurodeles waltl]|uniref:Uncharacterized protein n=1 Tax=Pleurodeles waltl TaxID=8319 RepID=A0AAV7N1J0_PLEWA|nr:hypothetical protein NDU88_006811 [Pleurodeles waltl]